MTEAAQISVPLTPRQIQALLALLRTEVDCMPAAGLTREQKALLSAQISLMAAE
jgi:hypothetical protein